MAPHFRAIDKNKRNVHPAVAAFAPRAAEPTRPSRQCRGGSAENKKKDIKLQMQSDVL